MQNLEFWKQLQEGGGRPWTNRITNLVFSDGSKRGGTNDDHDYYHEDLLLEPFSVHRGLWRDFGFGMYAMAGSDTYRFRFNERHQGWGHEDNDFYTLVLDELETVYRHRDFGLIHQWHPKNCVMGKDLITPEQLIDCVNSKNAMEGSELGLELKKNLSQALIPDTGPGPGGGAVVAPANAAGAHGAPYIVS